MKAARKDAAPSDNAARALMAKKAGTQRTGTDRPVAKKAVAKASVAKKGVAKKAVAQKYAARADLGAPIATFFTKQPPHTRPILEELRKLIEAAAPEATSSIKWGMPFFFIDGRMVCALGGHKAHVNLMLPGPPGTYADPDGLLEPEAKVGRHLKLTSLSQLPRGAVRGWLRTAVEAARSKP